MVANISIAHRRRCSSLLLVWISSTLVVASWSFSLPGPSCRRTNELRPHHRLELAPDENECQDISSGGEEAPLRSRRRAFLSAFLLSTGISCTVSRRDDARAVVVETSDESSKVFTAGQSLGVDQARKRFTMARESLDYLVNHYDEISKGGGDNVRRYLGTVGTTSGLYGINKVLKELQSEADDVVEFTENMSEFDYSLRAADTAVYSANFVEYSAAKTKPEQFFEDARLEIERMQEYMDNMAEEIKLKQ